EVDEKKRNPLDFALWKASKPNEPSWESPWGPGRPGWHIECSAMSMHLLGDHLDIHGGGADLTFPHHENEIAQSEAVAGPQFARYWVHNGFVNIRQEKMSKSLGNVLNIRDILKTVHPEVLRLFLLSSHYRSPLDYSDLSIREAAVGLERLYSGLAALSSLGAGGEAETLPEELSGLREKFCDAMDDDFNTPRCLALLFDASRAINRIAADARNNPEVCPNKVLLDDVRSVILHVSANVLGILKNEPLAFLQVARRAGADQLSITAEEIENMIEERSAARKRKDFKRADEIRDELASQGIVLEDGSSGTSWKVKDSQTWK
ncbi:MAG: cysteinyl-tRNA synthetase, partial [Thermodesulfobacteriota bacterium]|nr:cysteinyl-tRNA synthetase [Thermodesulfobacteriota bacterium]